MNALFWTEYCVHSNQCTVLSKILHLDKGPVLLPSSITDKSEYKKYVHTEHKNVFDDGYLKMIIRL